MGALEDLITRDIHALGMEDFIPIEQDIDVHLPGAHALADPDSALLGFDFTQLQYQLSDLKIRFKSGRKIVKSRPLKPDRLTFKDSGEYCVWVKRSYRLHCRTNI